MNPSSLGWRVDGNWGEQLRLFRCFKKFWVKWQAVSIELNTVRISCSLKRAEGQTAGEGMVPSYRMGCFCRLGRMGSFSGSSFLLIGLRAELGRLGAGFEDFLFCFIGYLMIAFGSSVPSVLMRLQLRIPLAVFLGR
jgi:hypothetical protein